MQLSFSVTSPVGFQRQRIRISTQSPVLSFAANNWHRKNNACWHFSATAMIPRTKSTMQGSLWILLRNPHLPSGFPFAQISALGAGNKSFLGFTNLGKSKMSQWLLFPNHPNRSGYALKSRWPNKAWWLEEAPWWLWRELWRLILPGLAEKSVGSTHENDGFHPSLAPMKHILLLGVEQSYPQKWAWLKFEYLKCAKLGVISLFLDTTISRLINISSPYCIQCNPIKRNTY